MRIKKLDFFNINNLKGGPHIVSFEEEPLSTAGIFAIIGPTGSGKSTLLDVITLALYNRIPRHGRVSKSTMLNQGSVITHHTDKAYASVEYEVNGNRFTSTWSVETARTGNLKEYEMTLIDAQGRYSGLKKGQIPDKNAEIIGLNYDQFVKSIILSQGEFARFLKSGKNERGEMLEKLTGTKIYRDIGIAAYEKYKKVNQSLNNAKEVLDEIKLLEKSEKKEINHNLKLEEEKIKTLQAKIKMASSVLEAKSRIRQLSEKLNLLKVSLKENAQQIHASAEEASQLAIHQEVSEFNKEITLYLQAEQTIEQNKTFIEQQKQIISNAQKGIKENLTLLSNHIGTEVDESNFEQVKDDFVQKVMEIDGKLRNLQEKGLDERERINNQLKGLNIALSNNVNPEEAISILQNENSKLKQQLVADNITIDQNPITLRNSIKIDYDQLLKAKAIANIDQRIASFIMEQKDLEKEAIHSQKIIDTSQPMLQKQEEVLKTLNRQAELLVKRREDSLKIASLTKLRDELSEGEACPLCGSTDHPYLESHIASDQDAIQKEIEENKNTINTSQKELDSLKMKLNSATEAIRINTQKSNENQTKILELKGQREAEFKDMPNDIEDIEEFISSKESTLEKKESALQSLENLRQYEGLILLYKNLNEAVGSYRSLHEKRQNLYKGDNVKGTCDQLTKSITSLQREMKTAEELIKDKAAQIIQYQKTIDQLNIVLKPELAKRDLEDVKAFSTLLLMKEEAARIKNKITRLEQDKIRLNAEIKTIDRELDDALSKDSLPQISLSDLQTELLENETLRNELHNGIAEKKALLRQDQLAEENQSKRLAQIKELTKEVDKWSLLNQMIGSAKGDTFANYAQSLTLKNLLAHTNRRLQELSDRYLLNKPGKDGTLNIIDQYQGNTERAVTTLSGGEVFIISLALALSLSDMASRNIALESLFIDEGFGTLDQETLDVAMSTLEKLQSENKKQVGVISHVEALKERITTQIQLHKNAQGYSTIKIVS